MGRSLVEPSGTVYCSASLQQLLRRAVLRPPRQTVLTPQESSELVWPVHHEPHA